MDAEADRGADTAPNTAPGKTTPRRVSLIRSFSRPGQPAPQRTGRAAQSPRRLVERQTLEVAKHHRRSESPRQTVDRHVDGLSLFTVDRRLVVRQSHRLGRAHKPAPGPLIVSPSSRWRRRTICCLAHRAVRIATPYSQLPSRSASRIERAFWDRTRNTA